MNILAIDTSTDVLSLTLSVSGKTWNIDISAGVRHSELLMDWVDRLFASAGLRPKDLDAAACMKGPGSFTGLRIGFSIVKGFSAALGIPYTAVPTLDCVAAAHSAWPGIVLPVLDAKKERFFAALYRNGNPVTEYMDADIKTISAAVLKNRFSPSEPVLVTGSGAQLFMSGTGAGENNARANVSLDPFYQKGRSSELLHIMKNYGIVTGDAFIFSGPLYLRKSDAELNIDKNNN